MYVSKNPLPPTYLKSVAPAIFGEKSDSLSHNYGHIGTSNLIDFAADLGFLPVQVGQARSRSKDVATLETKKHLVRFRHESDIGREEAVDLLLHNSHDGKSSVQLRLGIFRMVCSNGMVVGDTMQDVRISHLKLTEDTVKEHLSGLFNQAPQLLERISAMKSTEMSMDVGIHIAKELFKSRMGEPEDFEEIWQEGRHHLLPRIDRVLRGADKGRSAWAVYNRFQENIQQAVPYYSPGEKRVVHMRKVTTAARSVEISATVDSLFMSNVPELAHFI